ncbi:TPA: hypothetical protein RG862_003688 [Enterobacter ludwigii]|nr:hypothetical protein [Enterobacter ludwigii]
MIETDKDSLIPLLFYGGGTRLSTLRAYRGLHTIGWPKAELHSNSLLKGLISGVQVSMRARETRLISYISEVTDNFHVS